MEVQGLHEAPPKEAQACPKEGPILEEGSHALEYPEHGHRRPRDEGTAGQQQQRDDRPDASGVQQETHAQGSLQRFTLRGVP